MSEFKLIFTTCNPFQTVYHVLKLVSNLHRSPVSNLHRSPNFQFQRTPPTRLSFIDCALKEDCLVAKITDVFLAQQVGTFLFKLNRR